MDVERILLRRLKDQSFEEIGVVIAESDKVLTVRLKDGSTEEHRIGPERVRVIRGSLIHVLRLFPDQLPQIFEDHPDEVVEQILRDSSKPLGVRGIKEKLQQTPISPSAIDRAWPSIRKHLDTNPNIGKSKGQRATYRWVGELSSSSLLDLVSSPHESPVDTSLHQPEGAPKSLSLPTSTSPVQDAHSEPNRIEGDETGVATDPDAQPDEQATDFGQPIALVPLVKKLLELGGPSDIKTSQQVALRVLECAAALSAAKDKELNALLELEGADAVLGRALVAARPARTRLLSRSDALLDDAAAAYVTTLALDEFNRANTQDRKKLAKAGYALLERLLLPPNPTTLPDELLVRVVVTIPSFSADPDYLLLSHATTLLARSLLQINPELPSGIAKSDLRPLARAVSVLPFEPIGGRSLLVSSLFALDPEIVLDEVWWRETNLEELADAARGPLAKVLRHSEISDSVVAPRVAEIVETVSSRRALLTIAAAPAEIARHITGERFGMALKRVSKDDTIAAEWVRAMTNTSELDAAREELSAVQKTASKFEAEVVRISASAEQLRADRDRLVELARLAKLESTAVRDAHERQIKLNLLRTLALLSLSVLESPAADADKALKHDVEFITANEGLTLIDTAGSEADFDPTRHDSMGQHIEAGTTVFVLRAGYTYTTAQESLVLVKAHVSKK